MQSLPSPPTPPTALGPGTLPCLVLQYLEYLARNRSTWSRHFIKRTPHTTTSPSPPKIILASCSGTSRRPKLVAKTETRHKRSTLAGRKWGFRKRTQDFPSCSHWRASLSSLSLPQIFVTACASAGELRELHQEACAHMSVPTYTSLTASTIDTPESPLPVTQSDFSIVHR